jgi:predicted RNase H-like HicB family nuclease
MIVGLSVVFERFLVYFSQGQTLDELEENIRDAYKLITENEED